MTRKHYKEFAQYFRVLLHRADNMVDRGEAHGIYIANKQIALGFVEIATQDNRSFSASRFLHACNLDINGEPLPRD